MSLGSSVSREQQLPAKTHETHHGILVRGCVPFFGGEEGEAQLVESGANALTAFKCCVKNNCWAEFLDWRDCRAAVCPKNGTPRLLDQEKFSAGLDRTDGPRDGRSELENAAQAVVFRAGPLRKRNGWTARAERYRVRENEAAIRAEWIGDAAPGPMRA